MPSSSNPAAQEEKQANLESKMDPNGILNVDVGILVDRILVNAPYAYPDLQKSFPKIAGVPAFMPGEVFNVVFRFIAPELRKPGMGAYTATLVANYLKEVAIMRESNSSNNFERALQTLFVEVATDVDKRLRNARYYSHGK